MACLFSLIEFWKLFIYIEDTRPLPDMCFTKLSAKLCLPFHSLNSIFRRAEDFSFAKLQYIIYKYCYFSFYVPSKKSLQSKIANMFCTYVFFQKLHHFVFVFKFVIYFEYIFVCLSVYLSISCEVRVDVHH